jgi:hypothetical protein
VDPDVGRREDPEPVLQADLRARVESEEVAGEVAEVAGSQRPREAMRHPERAGEARHAQRRRQRDEREVRLGRVDSAVAHRRRTVLRRRDGRLRLRVPIRRQPWGRRGAGQ